MSLLLTSNGLKGNIAEIFSTLLSKPSKDNVVAFVTTAAYGDEENPTWFYKYKNELNNMGITKINDFDLRNLTQQEVRKMLQESDIVYVNGGNTFFVLEYVRKSGFKNEIEKFLADGKLYIGVSAGSIICCPTIDTASFALSNEYPADANNVGMSNLTALNLIPFLISPHYEDSQKKLVEDQSKGLPYPVVAITDQQAILVYEDKITLVGEGEEVVFNEFDKKVM